MDSVADLNGTLPDETLEAIRAGDVSRSEAEDLAQAAGLTKQAGKDLQRLLRNEEAVRKIVGGGSSEEGAFSENLSFDTDRSLGNAFEVIDAALEGVEVADKDPNPRDLTPREQYIARRLQRGVPAPTLLEDIPERPETIARHLRNLRHQGYHIYTDADAGVIGLDGEYALRSSEHKGTRTRKANRWWEARHNRLVRNFHGLSTPDAELPRAAGKEDWVLHMTDLHAGDRVRDQDGNVIYSTPMIPDVVDYITRQALGLAKRHNASYDAAHMLWGGDLITCEGIYEGQFENLDAWLDEQVDILHDPLFRQVKAFAEAFDVVNVVCQTGNHGELRASATSRQANADLLLYKSIRNTIATLQDEFGVLENVRFRIGQVKAYRNFPMRGGDLRGHLRHGQNRRPQAETSARKKQWLSTLREHDFSVAYMGHHHVSGRIPWDGPPVIASGSPKPAGEFVEKLGETVRSEHQGMATVHGMSDEGVTAVFPIDSRNFETRPNEQFEQTT